MKEFIRQIKWCAWILLHPKRRKNSYCPEHKGFWSYRCPYCAASMWSFTPDRPWFYVPCKPHEAWGPACVHEYNDLHLDRKNQNITGDYKVIHMRCGKCGHDLAKELKGNGYITPRQGEKVTWN